MVKLRYAVSRTTDDRWPIVFREDCERTLIGDEGLLDLIERLGVEGYDIVDALPEKDKP